MALYGRPQKYKTNKLLFNAIEDYFNSISRTRVLEEKVETGITDDRGKPVIESVIIKNDFGQPITIREYLIPPSICAMCLFLGISRQTWSEYCDIEKNPQFSITTYEARARMESYLEQELISRQKGVQGIIFNLQNNYNWQDKKQVEFGERASKAIAAAGMSLSEKMALMEEMASEFGGTGESGETQDGNESGETQDGNESESGGGGDDSNAGSKDEKGTNQQVF